MARIRTIKPEFWDSPGTAKASLRARLFFIAMWNWADDWGIGTASPKQLIGFAFPHDDDIEASDFPMLAKEVAECFHVDFYTVAERPYFAIPSWDKHQRTERKARRTNPGPDEAESRLFPYIERKNTKTADFPTLNADFPDTEKEREKEREKEKEREMLTSDSDESDFSDDVIRLTNLLADLIRANGNKVNSVTKAWLSACDRLIRLDGYTPEQVEQVMRWSQQSEFWQSNILSMPKLREKFDTLKGQMFRDKKPRETNARKNMDTVAYFAELESQKAIGK